MNESLYIFLLTGLVSMSAALSAGALNKLPEAEKSDWLKTSQARVSVIFVGNLAALTLVGAMAFGFLTLHWSIPLTSMFITFPVVHLLIVQKLLGESKGLMLMTVPVLISIIILYLNWP